MCTSCLKNLWLFSIGILLINCKPTAPTQTSHTEQPNLILIIADDMAWDDCGAYGHPNIHTPNIDQLAQDGMLFHQAFLTTSSCSPSRASIITGTYPHQTDAEQLHWPLPGNRITFVEKLKAAGYWTAQAGKWHLGDAVKDRFDFLAPVGTGGFVFNPNADPASQETSVDDGSGCQEWIPTLQKRPKDRPFFLWLAAVDPHRPYDHRTDSIHTLSDVRVPPYLPDNDEVRRDLAVYYDEISRLDSYVGKVIEELEKEGLSENTLILFISDNGRPFPRDKTTLYDGGIKTPWIVKWPTQVKKGSESEALVSAVDIAPTMLSLAGIPSAPSFEGVDFSPILTAPETSVREFAYAEDHWHDLEDYTRAIRTTQFKYIRNFYHDLPNTPPADALRSPTFQSMRSLFRVNQLNEYQLGCFLQPRPQEELYDMEKDPFELKNLALDPTYQETLDLLRGYMEKTRKETQDQLPEQRTADEFNRETGEPLPNRIRPRPSKAEMEKEKSR